MRKGLLAGTILLFAAWFAVKALPSLTAGRPAIWATPTSTPYDVSQLVPVPVPARQRVCVDGMPWAPQARYVELQVLPGLGARAPEIGVEASAPGYRSDATIPAGLAQNDRAIARIRPASGELRGTLCVLNRGRRPLSFYGVGVGNLQAPVNVTIGGRPVTDRQLSVTLLSSPDRSMLGRLGEVLGHVAAFRPLSTWMVWIVLLLLVLGTPVGVAVALARAGAMDDEAAREEDAPTGPRGGW